MDESSSNALCTNALGLFIGTAKQLCEAGHHEKGLFLAKGCVMAILGFTPRSVRASLVAEVAEIVAQLGDVNFEDFEDFKAFVSEKAGQLDKGA